MLGDTINGNLQISPLMTGHGITMLMADAGNHTDYVGTPGTSAIASTISWREVAMLPSAQDYTQFLILQIEKFSFAFFSQAMAIENKALKRRWRGAVKMMSDVNGVDMSLMQPRTGFRGRNRCMCR